MNETIIRVKNNDFKEVESYLKGGYKIKHISACCGPEWGRDSTATYCYVVLSPN